MSFDWSEFFSLAEALTSNPGLPGPEEAALRSAASRAYYAVFHCALNLAKEEGFVPSNSGDDHKKVQAYFRNCKSSEIRKKIALELDRTYNNRCKADYDGDLRSRPSSLACNTIAMAKNVFTNLSVLSKESE
jgi:uncharacterized protein (UPF0332 family)